MKKVQKKYGATRARARKASKQKGKAAAKKRKPKAPTLNYERALSAVAKGKTLRNIARDAGSKADEANLANVGAAIVRRLRDRGRLQEAFDALQYTVADFARGVIEGTKAMKVSRIKVREGETDEIREFEDIDTAGRLAAREQYARAIGIYTMPLEGEKAASGLESVSDEMLLRMAAGEIDPALLAEMMG